MMPKWGIYWGVQMMLRLIKGERKEKATGGRKHAGDELPCKGT